MYVISTPLLECISAQCDRRYEKTLNLIGYTEIKYHQETSTTGL